VPARPASEEARQARVTVGRPGVEAEPEPGLPAPEPVRVAVGQPGAEADPVPAAGYFVGQRARPVFEPRPVAEPRDRPAAVVGSARSRAEPRAAAGWAGSAWSRAEPRAGADWMGFAPPRVGRQVVAARLAERLRDHRDGWAERLRPAGVAGMARSEQGCLGPGVGRADAARAFFRPEGARLARHGRRPRWIVRATSGESR
jgi:hypothetical protein